MISPDTDRNPGHLDGVFDGRLCGWASPRESTVPVPVEIFADGVWLATVIADEFRADVAAAGIADGYCGFSVDIRDKIPFDRHAAISARIYGETVPLSGSPVYYERVAFLGCADGIDDGEIHGWAVDLRSPEQPVSVDIFLGSSIVGQTMTIEERPDIRAWLSELGVDVVGRHGFRFKLDHVFDDGNTHSFNLRISRTSRELTGSPLAYKADWPRDIALADYNRWWERVGRPTQATLVREREAAHAFTRRPTFSIVMPTYNIPAETLAAAIQSVRNQTYGLWEVCLCDDGSSPSTQRFLTELASTDSRIKLRLLPSSRGIAEATNEALGLATGDYVAFLDHDDLLVETALFEFALVINQCEDGIDIIYSDEDKLDENGAVCEPHFKPDWDYDYFLCVNYICHFLAIKRTIIEAVGGLRGEFDGAQDYDLLLRLIEQLPRIHHVPKILYHWRKSATSTAATPQAKPGAGNAAIRALQDHFRRTGQSAQAEEIKTGLTQYRIRRATDQLAQAISLIVTVPTGEAPHQTAASLLRSTSPRPTEIIAIAADENETVLHRFYISDDRLETAQPALIAPPSSPARALNEAARRASGELLCFIDGGFVPNTSEWLAEMAAYAARPEISIVGCRLRAQDGRIAAMGALHDGEGRFLFPHIGLGHDEPGYMGRAWCTQRVAAVTKGGMLIAAHTFSYLSGFNEERGTFSDIDLCLRATARGTGILVLGHVELSAREGVTGSAPLAYYDDHELGTTPGAPRDPGYNVNFSSHQSAFAWLRPLPYCPTSSASFLR